MFCAFCPQTIWATSVGFCRNRPESSPDKMYRACEPKDQILKKIRTLQSPWIVAQEFELEPLTGLTPETAIAFSNGFVLTNASWHVFECSLGYCVAKIKKFSIFYWQSPPLFCGKRLCRKHVNQLLCTNIGYLWRFHLTGPWPRDAKMTRSIKHMSEREIGGGGMGSGNSSWIYFFLTNVMGLESATIFYHCQEHAKWSLQELLFVSWIQANHFVHMHTIEFSSYTHSNFIK